MSGVISLEPAVLRDKSQVYAGSAEEIRGIIGKLRSTQGELSSMWQGKSFQGFNDQFIELSEVVTKFSSLLDDIHKQMNSVAEIVEQTDAEIAKQMGFQK